MRTGLQLSDLARTTVAAFVFCLSGLAQVSAQTARQNSPPTPAQPEPSTQTLTRPQTQTQSLQETPAEGQSERPATPVDARRPVAAPDTSPEAADLSITARVTARELKFNVVPNPTVVFSGRPRRDTVWEAERHNLPQAVRPGETYRDIGITLRITSVFSDIERIVAEALGEIPVSEDAPPAQRNEPPAEPSPVAPPQQNLPAASGTPEPPSPAHAPPTQTPTPRRVSARRGNRK
jgi:hypothetical protein